MNLLVVGSVAIDTVRTPFGAAEDVLGGSAVYSSFAAAHFCPVRLVGVVGGDFPEAFREALQERGIDLEGLEVTSGKTFRWTGRYEGGMAEAETLEVQLNALENFSPRVPESFRDSEFVFLGNGPPATQMSVLEQMEGPLFVLADTMNLWIETEREAFLELLKRVDGVVLNDAEARQLSGLANLVAASHWIRERGPRYCLIKKGEHGSVLSGAEGLFVLPAYPTDELKDPTGAGDSFAGGLMGYLASRGEVSFEALKMGVAHGTIMASFTIEDFSVAGLRGLDAARIEERLLRLAACTHFMAES